MKRKIIALVIVIATLAGIFTTAAFSAGEDPGLNIAACTLSLNDTIYIKYAVTGNGLDGVKLLVWTSARTDYEYGTQNRVLEYTGTTTVSGKSAKVFQYTELAAKQMGDFIYARAYLEKDGVRYYSPVKKYSILQYIYNKTGRTGTASTDQNLINLLNAMLEYGKMAQIYFGYKTDRLVTFDYYQIKVVGGTLSDGCDSGLYLPGDAVTLIAPETNASGEEFSHWQKNGTVIGPSNVIEIISENENSIYTAVYGNCISEHAITEDVALGNIVTFGKFRLNAELSFERLEWIVIEITDEGRVSLVSKNVFPSGVEKLFSDEELNILYDGTISINEIAGYSYAANAYKPYYRSFSYPNSNITIMATKTEINMLPKEDRAATLPYEPDSPISYKTSTFKWVGYWNNVGDYAYKKDGQYCVDENGETTALTTNVPEFSRYMVYVDINKIALLK